MDSNFNVMNQIQELQKQLERDKMELANLAGNKESENAHNENSTANRPIENQTQFLENIQQLIHDAKGLVGTSKDPRQSSSNDGRQVRSFLVFFIQKINFS